MGEGAFHQFHGGVTTGGIGRAKRELLLEQFNVQYESLRGEPFQPPQTKPVYIGELSPYVERFIRLSVEMQEGQAESKPLRPVSTLVAGPIRGIPEASTVNEPDRSMQD